MRLLFATEPYKPLAEELLEQPDNQLLGVNIVRKVFPDGERYLRVPHHVKDAECIILGGTIDTDSIFEILNLGYQLVSQGAKKLTFMIPYFGYQTMERVSKDGEVVMAKTMAHWLSSVPKAAYGNEVILLEPHTDTLAQYFEPHTRTQVVSSMDVVMKACVELAGTSFVLGSTDVGRAKTIEYIQREFARKHREYNIETAFVYKRRMSGTETEITGINADVKDKIVVIYDDMIKTGGSLMKAAAIYKQHGAKEVYAVATHAVLPGNSAKNLAICDALEKVAVTNSHPNCKAIDADLETVEHYFYRLYSVAGLLSRYA